MLFVQNTVKPVYYNHPWDPKKLPQSKLVYKLFWLVLSYAVVDRWPLFRGSHLHRFDCTELWRYFCVK